MQKVYKFSADEIKQLIIASVALAFAFSMVLFRTEILAGGWLNFFKNYKPYYFLGSLVAVGSAFVLHELSHKFVAQKKGLWSEFRYWPAGLIVAVVSSVFGFVFAAPGATMISPIHKKQFGYSVTLLKAKDMGHIGIAGIVTNLLLGAAFGIITILTTSYVFKIAAYVNVWLAIFNLIPLGPLDGVKVLKWSPAVWLGTLAVGAVLFFIVMLV